MMTLTLLHLLITNFFILGLFLIFLIVILGFVYLLRKKMINADIKLNNIVNKMTKLCSYKIDIIKNGYNFIFNFESLYKKYQPYCILVNSFIWNKSINNFKMNNILRIKDDIDPFDVLKDHQNIPISDVTELTKMIVNGDDWVCFDNSGFYYRQNIKKNYIFLKKEYNKPIFTCVLSFEDDRNLSKDDIEDILNIIKKTIF